MLEQQQAIVVKVPYALMIRNKKSTEKEGRGEGWKQREGRIERELKIEEEEMSWRVGLIKNIAWREEKRGEVEGLKKREGAEEQREGGREEEKEGKIERKGGRRK